MKNPVKSKSISIEKLLFDTPGKIALKLQDGRMIIAPIRFFPELKKLSIAQRKKYTVVDNRTVLFSHANSVYHLEDFIGPEGKWRER